MLNRIRDIRSSEKMFWTNMCDIYATSINYDGKAQQSMRYLHRCKKMHWAAHGPYCS
ncbi:MAG: virulence RhuM family protein [Psychrobium sp.]|nr:virulence RhuM family protein [Psychrobium sp.]